MGHIVVEKGRGKAGAAIQAQGTADRFSRLKRSDALGNNTNIGGRFALPPEFDTKKMAANFVAEGNEMASATRDQPVMGTALIAEGWQVWKYPKSIRVPTGERDDEGNLKLNPKTKEPLTEEQEHPLAGQPHKIPPLTKDGQTLVLMWRPLEVQEQVNEAYGELSRENMIAEVDGDQLSVVSPDGGAAADDSGMLTQRDLEADRTMAAEKRFDADERERRDSARVKPTLKQAAGFIKRKDRVVRA